MKYKKELLGSYIDILSGFAFKRSDFVECGIPIIKITNINSPNVTLNDLTYVSRECANKQKKFYLSYNDVLIAMTGSHINQITSVVGRVARVKYHKKTLLNQRVGKITIKKDAQADINYIYYFLTQDIVKYELALKAGGAANQANISSAHIKGLEFPCPELNIQKKIGAILSTYDDLIENNQKQIKLLEEAAQRLYKEWFVDLRFLGYETTPIIDGVPKGWEKEFLTNLVDVQYGYAFNGAFFNNTGCGMPIVRIRNIPEGITMDFTTEEASKEYIVHNGDILVGMDGEFHINSWGGKDAYLVQRTCCLRPKFNYMKGYLFQAIAEPIKYFEKTVVGATVAHLGKKHIDTIKIFKAPVELYRPFQIWYEKRQSLINQNRLLVEARDRLLPKLMNGELEV